MRLFSLAPFFLRRMMAELAEIQRAGQRVDRRTLAGYALLGGLSAIVAGYGLWWAVSAGPGGAGPGGPGPGGAGPGGAGG